MISPPGHPCVTVPGSLPLSRQLPLPVDGD